MVGPGTFFEFYKLLTTYFLGCYMQNSFSAGILAQHTRLSMLRIYQGEKHRTDLYLPILVINFETLVQYTTNVGTPCFSS